MMKKIIELAEKALDALLLPGSEITQEMTDAFAEVGKAINKRRELEQTPITEDWLKEHGFILEADGYVLYDDSKGTHDQHYVSVQLRHNKQEARRIEIRTMWRSVYLEQGTFNVSFFLDACELCGINLED